MHVDASRGELAAGACWRLVPQHDSDSRMGFVDIGEQMVPWHAVAAKWRSVFLEIV